MNYKSWVESLFNEHQTLFRSDISDIYRERFGNDRTSASELTKAINHLITEGVISHTQNAWHGRKVSIHRNGVPLYRVLDGDPSKAFPKEKAYKGDKYYKAYIRREYPTL